MSLAFAITLEKPVTNLSAKPSGKALAREAERLDLAARTCKVAPLTIFLSESSEALIAQMKADGFDPSKMRIPPEQWFSADEGLASVNGLIDHVGKNLNNFKQPNPILRDLKAAAVSLEAAKSAGVRFHLSRADL